MATSCAWPDKYRHATEGAAWGAIRSLREDTGREAADLRPYRCGDHWHVGHDRRALEKRIRKALRRRS